VATGFWPSEIDFTARDLSTAIDIINKERKGAKK